MKEYMLLRNNKQTGPHSLDELKGMNLKPFDLIWHQKKSASWKYPSEMDELAAFIPVIETLNTASGNTKNETVPLENVVVLETVQHPVEHKAEVLIAEEEAPVRYIRHVVALKPTIDNTQVKTIKPTNQPNIIKVEIRDKEVNSAKNSWEETSVHQNNRQYQIEPVRNTIPSYNTSVDNNVTINKYSAGILSPKMMHAEVADNRLEWMMLVIGATSLIAIVYLLLTSPY